MRYSRYFVIPAMHSAARKHIALYEDILESRLKQPRRN